MSDLQLAVLALVQGITEFLPISSSGHLVLVPVFMRWPDQGLTIDVAVHVGTLAAVVLYFRRDVARLFLGAWTAVRGRRGPEARLLGFWLLASLPVMVAGFFLAKYAGEILRSAALIGWTTLIFGLVLYLADRFTLRIRRLEHLTMAHALVIGLLQCLALVPGTSRAGITITAARLLGYERTEAARFSMLLSIPAILGAGVLLGERIVASGDVALGLDALVAAALAGVAALVAISLMMAWLRRASYTPFVLYRIALGGVILWFVYGGAL
ncbi:MAG: undecaprenyl-diphosphate phosphatase [Alphaproteobacteria bacterium]